MKTRLDDRTSEELGRICATAMRLHRQLQTHTRRYRRLYDNETFDSALLAAIAHLTAIGCPWLALDRQEVVARIILWEFALDFEIDYRADSPAQVHDIVERCAAVAAGAPAADGDELAGMLAGIRRALVPVGCTELLDLWAGEIHRSLTAQERVRAWHADRTSLPSLDEYLAQADSLNLVGAHVTEWILDDPQGALRHLDVLLPAARTLQVATRLANDLATHHRDETWGDINSLVLGADRSVVVERMRAATQGAAEALAPLRARGLGPAEYSGRMLSFASGFYAVTDFWGELGPEPSPASRA